MDCHGVQGKARGRARRPRDPRIARGALPWPFYAPLGLLTRIYGSPSNYLNNKPAHRPGGARRSQGESGGARRDQEDPAGPRRTQEEPKAARRTHCKLPLAF